MKIRFVHTCELEVVTDYDRATDQAVTEVETFLHEGFHKVDVFDDHGHCIDIQFGDGSCIYGLSKTAYEVIAK